MLLEMYIDKGVILERVLDASRFCPITFDNGEITVGNEIFGISNHPFYSLAVIEEAIMEACRNRREK